MKNTAFRIALMPGDGIGVEVIDACVAVLDTLQKKSSGWALSMDRLDAGAQLYKATGTAMSEETFQRAANADAILLGAMGWPEIRYPDGTEIAPQLDLRFRLGLYAGVRPIRALPGMPLALADPRAKDIDFVILRESTEGMFASRGRGEVIDDREARDTQVITRDVSERLFDFAFRLAESRRGRGGKAIVTCVDKANVFRSFAFFRKIFDERARAFPSIAARHHYVDACALDLVRKPWEFDVMVTENLFGDILSDLAAGLIGGMGFAPSADVGDKNAVFQPSHGTAPDIAGKGIANPTATLLSAVLMLRWLGERHAVPACGEAADRLEQAVDAALGSGSVRPYDAGGRDGTGALARAVIERL
ncbi:MAG: isocitrate/isopropylmalate dehydrogenase family protein [Alphaproteobacteria bacterium]|nr:isocitrate/isopropylmalate dehydrogenase family protein [Alphaproteobacteria bacterium]